jgi:hypothetical protein
MVTIAVPSRLRTTPALQSRGARPARVTQLTSRWR